MRLSALLTYPIKSCGGISHESASLVPTGLRNDRRWMLTDPAGTFLSQRTHPTMARIRVEELSDALRVSCGHHPSLTIPLEPPTGVRTSVQIWDDSVDAVLYPDEFGAWFSEILNTECRLAYCSDHAARLVNPNFGRPADRVGFADAYPILLTTEASLAELNSRLSESVTIDRFRPNLVIAGTEAFAEDRWTRIRIGDTTFRVVKPCTRCSVPSVDQHTGLVGQEPMRTLATFRTFGNRVLFGQNAIHDSLGTLTVGMSVDVLEEQR